VFNEHAGKCFLHSTIFKGSLMNTPEIAEVIVSDKSVTPETITPLDEDALDLVSGGEGVPCW
jgi:hypothetical protein